MPLHQDASLPRAPGAHALPPNAMLAPPVKQPIMPPEGLPGEPVEQAAPEATKPASKPEMAVLRFLKPETVSKLVPLQFPFAYSAEGGEIEVNEVTIRRLSVAEIGDLIVGKDPTDFDLFEFYAIMTGLPIEVLRAMPADEEVIDACLPFLPQLVRDLLEALSSGFGGATPSLRPERAPNRSATS